MRKIRAIQTEYQDYRFRSRLEAKWAVFFDTAGLIWEYEKEGFELEHGRYLPDFWLPGCGFRWKTPGHHPGVWVEIKGEKPTDREVLLAEDLCLGTEQDVLLLWGFPQHPDEFGRFRNCQGFAFHPVEDDLLAELLADPDEYGGAAVVARWARYGGCLMQLNDFALDHLLGLSASNPQAIKAARSARFEHGERPG